VKTRAIVNAHLFTPFREIKNAVIIIKNDKIARVGEKSTVTIPKNCEKINAENDIVAPGFIDIHVHGGGGYDTMDATLEAFQKIAETHIRGGTTLLLLSTVTAPIEEIEEVIKATREVMRQAFLGSQILGLHLEGPYISRKQKGAHDEKYIKKPTREEIKMLLKNTDVVRRVTAAPEIKENLQLGKILSEKGVIMSIGHTNGTIRDVVNAMEHGYTHVTHIYSGMTLTRRLNAYRVPGVVEATFLFDELTTEIIADGKHLPPELIKLVLKNKGVNNVCIVTDAMRAAGLPPGKYKLGTIEAIVEDGVAWLPDWKAFAGSITLMNQMIKILVERVKIPLIDALKMATVIPAKIMRIKNKGSVTVGKDADIVILDKSNLKVRSVIIDGHYRFEYS